MKTTAKKALKLCFFLLFVVTFAYVFPGGLALFACEFSEFASSEKNNCLTERKRENAGFLRKKEPQKAKS